MARGKSASYDDQRGMILARAAQLFGQRKKPARHNRSASEPHCTAPGWLLFVICHETDEWCGWRGSNPRPLASEAQITIIEIASFHEGFKTL